MKKSCMTFFGINLKATSCAGHLFFTALKAGREPKRTNVILWSLKTANTSSPMIGYTLVTTHSPMISTRLQLRFLPWLPKYACSLPKTRRAACILHYRDTNESTRKSVWFPHSWGTSGNLLMTLSAINVDEKVETWGRAAIGCISMCCLFVWVLQMLCALDDFILRLFLESDSPVSCSQRLNGI